MKFETITDAIGRTPLVRLAKISTGLPGILFGKLQLAAKPENAGKTIVTMLPDSGERYISTQLSNVQEEN